LPERVEHLQFQFGEFWSGHGRSLRLHLVYYVHSQIANVFFDVKAK